MRDIYTNFVEVDRYAQALVFCSKPWHLFWCHEVHWPWCVFPVHKMLGFKLTILLLNSLSGHLPLCQNWRPRTTKPYSQSNEVKTCGFAIWKKENPSNMFHGVICLFFSIEKVRVPFGEENFRQTFRRERRIQWHWVRWQTPWRRSTKKSQVGFVPKVQPKRSREILLWCDVDSFGESCDFGNAVKDFDPRVDWYLGLKVHDHNHKISTVLCVDKHYESSGQVITKYTSVIEYYKQAGGADFSKVQVATKSQIWKTWQETTHPICVQNLLFETSRFMPIKMKTKDF